MCVRISDAVHAVTDNRHLHRQSCRRQTRREMMDLDFLYRHKVKRTKRSQSLKTNKPTTHAHDGAMRSNNSAVHSGTASRQHALYNKCPQNGMRACCPASSLYTTSLPLGTSHLTRYGNGHKMSSCHRVMRPHNGSKSRRPALCPVRGCRLEAIENIIV